MIINNLGLSFGEFIKLVLEIIGIIGFLILVSLGLFQLSKPIIRLFIMDKMLGDNSRDLDFAKDKHLFYKFYLVESERGKLLFYIGNKNKKLDDGKRITERFFVFRKKDNLRVG